MEGVESTPASVNEQLAAAAAARRAREAQAAADAQPEELRLDGESNLCSLAQFILVEALCADHYLSAGALVAGALLTTRSPWERSLCVRSLCVRSLCVRSDVAPCRGRCDTWLSAADAVIRGSLLRTL